MMNEIVAFTLSLGLTIVLYPAFIVWMNTFNKHQAVNEYSLKEFKDKKKTPTMGGVLFVLIPIIVMMALYPKTLSQLPMILLYLVYLAFGLIGFIDDYIIVIKHDNKGLRPIYKFLAQLILAIVFYFFYQQASSSLIHIPLTNINLDLGWFYALFVFVMFTAESNAVNLTDGMDGLAGGTVVIALIGFAYLAYADYREVSVFILCVIGALLAYLNYNRKPASIIMGDTGSLALGALLAAIAMVTKQELLLLVLGGVFLFETLCVVIQIGSVKLRGKRVFRYTPIHYSFTLEGWSETKTVLFFYGLGFICLILGIWMGV